MPSPATAISAEARNAQLKTAPIWSFTAFSPAAIPHPLRPLRVVRSTLWTIFLTTRITSTLLSSAAEAQPTCPCRLPRLHVTSTLSTASTPTQRFPSILQTRMRRQTRAESALSSPWAGTPVCSPSTAFTQRLFCPMVRTTLSGARA